MKFRIIAEEIVGDRVFRVERAISQASLYYYRDREERDFILREMIDEMTKTLLDYMVKEGKSPSTD